MANIRLVIELIYDDQIMYGTDPEAKEWFFDVVLGSQLFLHSNVLGDCVGSVRVIKTDITP